MGIIRVFLALAVVYGHIHGKVPGVKWLTGDTAVQVFFVVSGFYMALVLTEKYNTPQARVAFYKNRLLRLYPTYFAVMALAAIAGIISYRASGPPLSIAQWVGPESLANLPSRIWFGIANFTVIGQDFTLFQFVNDTGAVGWTENFRNHIGPNSAWEYIIDPPAWSLSLELMFYAIAPFMNRFNTRWLIGVACLSFGLRAYLWFGLGLNFDPWTYRFFPTELLFFVLGMLAYRFYKDRVEAKVETDRAKFGLYLAYAFLVIAPYVKYPWFGYGVAMAVLIPYVFHASRHSERDRNFGELSYPIYISHWPIMVAFESQHFFGLGEVPKAVLMLGTTTFVAWLLHKFLELPIEQLRRSNAKKATAPV